MDKPIAVILAAGQGTRMKSDLPKVLCRANGKPLIAYVIDALQDAGIDRFVVVVGYKGELVKEELANVKNIEFALQSEQLGTGHAVMMCRDILANHNGPVVIVAGDSPMLQATSVELLLKAFSESGAACVMGTLLHDDPTGLGRIVRDEAGEFAKIVEHKDATPEQLAINEVNMSTYVFDCQKMLSVLDQLTDDNQQGEYYVTDVPGIMLNAGETVQALPVLQSIEALSVNTPEHLLAVEQAMKN